jgi:D-lactate dehydrogenase (cytochrome)
MVLAAKSRLIDIFAAFGCAHFQIGRTYPYRQSRDETAWGLLQAAKTYLRPEGSLNPGVLGLGPTE